MHPASEPRAVNRSAILSVLLSGNVLQRNEIVEASGLSRATVFRVIDDLRARGYVIDVEAAPSGSPGRPSTPVAFNGAVHTVCGIDLGGTNCRLAIADALGSTLARSKFPTPHDLDGESMGRWMAAKVRELADSIPPAHGAVGAVAIGVPGAVSSDRSAVVGSHNLPQILGTSFIDSFRDEIGVPVTLDNDSNLALVGELQYGGLAENETAALLTLGTGLGSAVALDGSVLYGRTGILGEFGRLQVPGTNTRLRDLVSGAGLISYAREHGYEISSASEVLAEPARFPELLSLIHAALVHLVSLVGLAYEPRTVIVTGGFADGLGLDVFERVQNDVLSLVGVSTLLRRTQLGDYAGLLGSVAVALGDLYASFGVLEEHIAGIDVARERAVDALESVSVIAE